MSLKRDDELANKGHVSHYGNTFLIPSTQADANFFLKRALGQRALDSNDTTQPSSGKLWRHL